jgi:methanogenic corrinoid protein MtbC1
MVVYMGREVPSDEQVMEALASKPDGLTPDEIISYFESDHELSNIIEAIQRVLDRGKVVLGRGGCLQSRQALQAAA